MTQNQSRDAARFNFIQGSGWGEGEIIALKGDASFRRYFRLRKANGQSVMLMDAPPPHNDSAPFVTVARGLTAAGLSAPRVLVAAIEAGFLLLEDLGDLTYSRALAQGYSEAELYRAATQSCLAIQTRNLLDLKTLPDYDWELYRREIRLFTDWYLPSQGVTLDESSQSEYEQIWRELLRPILAAPRVLVLRDFHVDNLMVLPRDGVAGVGLLDFQDAVAGHRLYDLVSLLDDARRVVTVSVVQSEAEYFRQQLGQEPAEFERDFALLSLQRNFKILGIFVRLAVRDGKPHYLEFIPHLWRLVGNRIDHPAAADLKNWLARHCPPQPATTNQVTP